MNFPAFTDTYRQKGERKLLAAQLQKKGINDEKVLAVIAEVPRHFFFPKDFWDHAYEDKAFQIGAGQTISHPHTVAYQSQLLQITEGDVVLEIGTGSGYQTAVLLALGAEVYSIERQEELYEKTKALFNQLKLEAYLFFGDGSKGLAEKGPFDKIICTAGAPTIPTNLLAQLKITGKMVIPVGDEINQKMNLVTRVSEKEFHTQELETFRFVPLIGEQAW